MRKQKKMIALTVGVSITFSFAGIQTALADTVKSTNSIHKQQLELKQVENKKNKAMKEANQLQQEIADKVKQYNKTQADIKNTQQKIDHFKKEILDTQKRIERRSKLLKSRVREMYKNGGSVNFLEVVLGSQNFNDFLDRVLAMNLIANQDQDLLNEQKADKKQLESDKEKIMDVVDKLQNKLDSLSKMKNELGQKIKTKNALVKKLKEKGIDIKKNIQSQQQAIQIAQSQESTSNNTDSGDGNAQQNHSSSKNHSSSDGNHDVQKSHSLPSGSVSAMIQAGKRYIGNSSYVYGGGRTQAQIQNGLFDCSGFVHWAFQQIGVNVGWSTSSLKSEGTRVSRSDLQPGDMVFFDTNGSSGHVGIYIGNNRFIGSQSSSGVEIENMNNSYWGPVFNHGQRVLH